MPLSLIAFFELEGPARRASRRRNNCPLSQQGGSKVQEVDRLTGGTDKRPKSLSRCSRSGLFWPHQLVVHRLTTEGIEPPTPSLRNRRGIAGHGNFVAAKIVSVNLLAAISEAWRHSGDIKVNRSSKVTMRD
jgi:hypothetical protein